MYKFYWSNLQKTPQSPTSCNAGQSTSTSSSSNEVWTRQNATNTASMPVLGVTGNNPEPLPARSGRPTTVRVTSPFNERERHSITSLTSPMMSTTPQPSHKIEKPAAHHHTPTGSHRVLLKLRRGAQAARPKSVHGVEQVMTSEHRPDRLNLSSDDSPSILETLANLRTGEGPTKSGKKQGLPTSKSLHHFYSRTWTEKTLQRYQHNYENVYNNDNNNDDNPVYENVYFRHGGDNPCDNLVIGQMMQSPRTASRMRHIQQQQQSSPDFYRPFNPPPEPSRSVPPVPPDRKCRSNPKNSSSTKPLYRSKSCERPKMKEAMRDTFRDQYYKTFLCHN